MSYIDKINRDGTDYDIQDSYAARSVEGTTASHVLQANEIFTETTQTQFAEFIYRTSAGDASIQTGPAQLEAVYGAAIADPSVQHVDEVLTATPTFANEETTLEFNKNTWRSKVSTSGEYEFSYNGSNWRLDGSNVTLSQYGLTITGTVTSGDTINVSYTKMQTGTLTVANPTAFVATGFNQYNATAGYAHVVGGNQYRIAGTYTSLTFSTTPTGTTSAVTVTDNRFVPVEDGYIHVVGGSGNILIALVWSGIMDDEPWSAYETSTIVVPTQDAEGNNLPNASYGMPGIGNIRDSISFTEKLYIQRIGHLPFTYDNLETIQNSGAPYIYDTTHIFYALAAPITYTLADTVGDDYTVNDFGTEEFTGTTIPVYAGIRYGNSLVDKLRNLVDIQDVGDDLTMDGSTIKTAHELKDDVPAGFFSGEATVSGEGSEFTLEGGYKVQDMRLLGKTEQEYEFDKNMFNKNAVPLGSGGPKPTLTVVSTGVKLAVAGTSPSYSLLVWAIAPLEQLKGKTVTLSSDISASISTVRPQMYIGTSNAVGGGTRTNRAATAIGATGHQVISWEIPLDITETDENAYLCVALYASQGGTFNVGDWSQYDNLQLEIGDAATSYTDYVLPKPNPTNPKDVNIVTGTQNVQILNNNLFDYTDIWSSDYTTTDADGWITASVNNASGSSTKFANFFTRAIPELKPNTQYAIVVEIKAISGNGYFYPYSGQAATSQFTTNKSIEFWRLQAGHTYVFKDTTKETLPTGDSAVSLRSYVNYPAKASGKITYRLSILEDTTVTPATFKYCPRQKFTLDLGNIELCHIGAFQDSIYKQNDKWYLHKECDVSNLGTLNWIAADTGDGANIKRMQTSSLKGLFTPPKNNDAPAIGYCEYFRMLGATDTYHSAIGISQHSTYGEMHIYHPDYNTTSSPTDFTAWLNENNIKFYYARAQFTDTEITDSTLLSQLNAINNFAVSLKANQVSVTATSLPMTIKIQAYKQNMPGLYLDLTQ